MPSAEATSIKLQIDAPQPLDCCRLKPKTKQEDGRLVLVCTQCGREAGVTSVLPPNCRSRAMVDREVTKLFRRVVREWNTHVLSPHGRPGIILA